MKNFHRGSEDNKNYSIEISTKLKKYEINCPIFYIKCSTIRTYIHYEFRVKIAQRKIHKFLWVDKNRYLRGIDRQTNLRDIFINDTNVSTDYPPIIRQPNDGRKAFHVLLCTWTESEIRVDVIFLSVATIVFSAYHRTTIIRHPLDRFSALLQFVSIQLQLSLG